MSDDVGGDAELLHLGEGSRDQIEASLLAEAVDEDRVGVDVWIAGREGLHLVDEREGLFPEGVAAVGADQCGVDIWSWSEALGEHDLEEGAGVPRLAASSEHHHQPCERAPFRIVPLLLPEQAEDLAQKCILG